MRKLVGWNVRRLRVARLMTIEELAHRAGMDASYVASLERGEVNVGIVKLDALARALSIRFVDLAAEPMPGEKPPKPLPAGRRPSKIAPRRKAAPKVAR